MLIGRRGATRALAAANEELERTLEGGEERAGRLSAARTEIEHLRAEMTRTDADLRRQTTELGRLQGELGERQHQLEAARRELAAAKDQKRSALEDKTRLEAAAEKHKAAEAAVREALARAEDERAELDKARGKIRELEATLDGLKIERIRWQERERQLEQAQKVGVDPELEATLRHDLAVARETGRTLDEQRQRLEELNAQLRSQLASVTARVGELTGVERENAELRIRAMAADLAVRSAVADKDRRSPAAEASLGGQAFQTLVDRMGGLEPVRSAVIADELGLVVASHGSHGEELAAIGALFARSGSEARKVLPLDQLQRVIVEDERNISVTVRPLRSTDAGTSDSELTLVTLAVGAEPDAGQVARILHGRSGVPAAAQVES